MRSIGTVGGWQSTQVQKVCMDMEEGVDFIDMW